MLKLFVALFIMVSPAAAQDTRPVYIFGAGDAADRQMAALRADTAGLSGRDIRVVQISGNRVTALTGPDPQVNASTLRRRFKVRDDEFRFVLVGKDVGVKLSDDAPVTLDRLFGLIDAMPMRQQEMRR